MKKRGFTLIELLVVIAIIGILAGIIMASLTSAKARARDAKRITDIKTIQLALELYYNDNLFFPSNIYAASCSSSVTPNCGLAPLYISVMPSDPNYTTTCSDGYTQASCYKYVVWSSSATCTLAGTPPTKYHLAAILEQTGNAILSQDADLYQPTSGYVRCNNAVMTDFNGLTMLCTATANAADGCYDVTN